MTLGRQQLRSMFFVLAGFAGLVVFMAVLYRVSSPHLLMPYAGGRWVVSPNLVHLAAEGSRPRVSQFRTVLALPAPLASSPVLAQLRSLGASELFINGSQVVRSQSVQGRLEMARVDVAPYLRSGDNDIRVFTRHSLGPAAIHFSLPEQNLMASMDWQVSVDGSVWNAASTATDSSVQTGVRPESVMQWNGTDQLAEHMGLVLLLAASGAVGAFVLRRKALAAVPATQLLRAWQWTLLLGLALLHAWNFKRLPPSLGMDFAQHVDYIRYILRMHALPFADQGWQMFQPPFAYLIAAAVESLRAEIAPGFLPLSALRLLTLAVSLTTAWVVCRICTLAFERAGTAALAMVIAVFLPVNLYMAPAFGNEPFAALFGALMVLESVALLKGISVSRWIPVRIGLWLGLGLLSKPSVVLLLPAILVLVTWRGRCVGGSYSLAIGRRSAFVMVAIGFLIAGWWYVRNMLRFGRPFVGGWESGRGGDWWQYPGFRVPEHWLRFGESLVRPLYSGLDSFWDSIYSTLWLDGWLSGQIQMSHAPQWNYSFMVALAILSLPVLLASIWGVFRATCRPSSVFERDLARFLSANFVIFLMAMALMYGQVPGYSAGKGSYLLCALGGMPILVGLGVDGLLQRPAGSLAVSAYAAVWLGFVVLAFIG